MSTMIEMTAGKDFLEACYVHDAETVRAHETHSEVSPMTWGDAGYEFTITWDDGEGQPEDDQQLQEDDPELSAQRAMIQHINASDIVRDFSLRLEDEPLSSPLIQEEVLPWRSHGWSGPAHAVIGGPNYPSSG